MVVEVVVIIQTRLPKQQDTRERSTTRERASREKRRAVNGRRNDNKPQPSALVTHSLHSHTTSKHTFSLPLSREHHPSPCRHHHPCPNCIALSLESEFLLVFGSQVIMACLFHAGVSTNTTELSDYGGWLVGWNRV
jgi:hypothetical protein